MSLLALANLLPSLEESKGQMARPLESTPKELSREKDMIRLSRFRRGDHPDLITAMTEGLQEEGIRRRRMFSCRKFINIIIF
jgi:hypothetical protein